MALIIPEKKIDLISGRAIPKPANKQDTDAIMPARFLKEITFRNMGTYVYAGERFRDNVEIQSHPFNNPKYAGANILLAGADYGCGSSREHAPQGLLRYGIKAIVAEGFHEIFAGNCAAIGLVPVTMDKKHIERLVQLASSEFPCQFSINLNEKILTYSEPILHTSYIPESFPIDLPEGRRQAFLNGTWDAMAVLQANEKEAEQTRKSLPYIYMKR